MRMLICLVGQSVVYDESCELFNELMGIELCAPQIQRVCTEYGNAIDGLVTSNCEAVIPRLESRDEKAPVYVMVDGSMVYTPINSYSIYPLYHSQDFLNKFELFLNHMPNAS